VCVVYLRRGADGEISHGKLNSISKLKKYLGKRRRIFSAFTIRLNFTFTALSPWSVGSTATSGWGYSTSEDWKNSWSNGSETWGLSMRLSSADLGMMFRDLWAVWIFYILPSKFEAHSLSLIEAIASGLSVIATTVCRVPTIVKNTNCGWLVEPNRLETELVGIELVIAPPERTEIISCARQMTSK
jgi:hypothetical protein